MKALLPSYFKLPFALLIIGTLTPLCWIVLLQDSFFDVAALLGWISNFWYVAISLAATEAVVRAIFVRPQEQQPIDVENQHLQWVVRNCMLGLILLACDWSSQLNSLSDAVSYLTMHVGITLLLLGGLVLAIAHRKMQAM
jgi:hypothetical protein